MDISAQIQKMAERLSSGESEKGSQNVDFIRGYLGGLVAHVRYAERERCAHDIIQYEGETLEKSTAVMLCMMGTQEES
jgi:hypothetical protein